jgi:hypothetical protein
MTPQPKPERVDVDLGGGVTLRWTELYGRETPAGEHFGAIVSHRKPDGSYCEGAITFNTALGREFAASSAPPTTKPRDPAWEPLSISPSVLCTDCGEAFHGHIQGGRWV